MRVAISFDYDSPVGYTEFFSDRKPHSTADLEGTEAILEVLATHRVRSTFAVVGNAALEGELPEHSPEQVRRVCEGGHEIASHSMYHRFLPVMRRQELIEDLTSSKRALEDCSGQRVRGFVPPFNRPSHFPRKGSFSISEITGLHGRGRSRQSVSTLLNALGTVGYGWCRVSFRATLYTLLEMLGRKAAPPPSQPFFFGGVVAMPLHKTGFGAETIALLRRYMDTDLAITLCGHPFQALDSMRGENSEHVDRLAEMLTTFEKERCNGKLKFCTMAEIETDLRSEQAAPNGKVALVP